MVYVSADSQEKEFLKSEIFSCQNWTKIDFSRGSKKSMFPLSPQFLMKSPKNILKSGPEFEETHFPFFDLGQKFEF